MVLGEGRFGRVRVGTCLKIPDKKVALKSVNYDDVDYLSGQLLNELEIMKQLDHPNIIKFYEVY